MASAFTVLALWHDEPWQVVVATTLQGAGSGLVFSSIAGVVVSSVPPQQAGVASAMNANIRSIGGSLGSAVMAGIVTTRVGTAGFPFERGYTLGFAVLATVTVCGAIVALAIPDRWENPSGSALVDAGNGELGVLPGGTVDARRH